MNILLILSAGICPGCSDCQPLVVADVAAEPIVFFDPAPAPAPQTVRPALLGLVPGQPEGTPTALLPPKPELWVGNKVYSAVHGSSDLHGRIFGMDHSFYDVVWEDGFRGRYTRDELELVFPEDQHEVVC